MGRVKLQIKRIEKKTNRQVTFSKHRNGLIKKAYELAVLCDIEIALIMFSPSDRLSHFSGKTRIEDVITRYINLPEHDRVRDVQNREMYLDTQEGLQSFENDIASWLPESENGHTPNSIRIGSETKQTDKLHSPNVEMELRQEIFSFQQQLQITEEQLRMFESDPLLISSMRKLESCEKNLLDVMAGLEARKKYLMSSHASTYDPSSVQMYLDTQEGLQSFENDIASWLPEVKMDTLQILFGVSFFSNQQSSTTIFDALSHGTNSTVTMDRCNNGVSLMDNSSSESLPAWYQSFSTLSSSELLAAFVPPTSFSLIKNEIEGPSFSSMIQQQHHADMATNCPQMQSSAEGSEYESSKLPQLNLD
ncbi:hypothetical protein K2173_005191 [Erythroxylum novogranatense]|uniref:MADS-box domain-containing protein n=1 Tax=Erythroxylum novogranatense TaxID=1862640 RepID=A0AAV8TS49_9ROSI|nr:hypothetical protein K2173_005191 [Erythroxylum novogranatense]